MNTSLLRVRSDKKKAAKKKKNQRFLVEILKEKLDSDRGAGRKKKESLVEILEAKKILV